MEATKTGETGRTAKIEQKLLHHPSDLSGKKQAKC